MNTALYRAIEMLLSKAGNFELADNNVIGSTPVSGGSINRAERVELSDGRQVFVKSNPDPLPGMFECEAIGLSALRDAAEGELTIPCCYGIGDNPLPFIVLEYVGGGQPPSDFSERLGRALATLHRRSSANLHRYGFTKDNYIGSTPQPNAYCDDWVVFYRQRRLEYQLKLAVEKGFGRQLTRLGNKLLARLDDVIGEPQEPSCLLHGDLWGGNYFCDKRGMPVLIDPAVYYGQREAELAMTTLFGGFDRAFYSAYDEIWPLAPGANERFEIYKLYHLLNHLNLFGSSYLGSCLSILHRFA